MINNCIFSSDFCVKRDPKWGGDKVYTVFEEVEKDFAAEVTVFNFIKCALSTLLNFYLSCLVFFCVKSLADSSWRFEGFCGSCTKQTDGANQKKV